MSSVLPHGFHLEQIALPESIQTYVTDRDWNALDEAIHKETRAGGVIFERLRSYTFFEQIEFIISIRPSIHLSADEKDEDGIWHDDGSRVLAFSLSLTLDHLGVGGGILEIKRKALAEQDSQKIATPAYGTMIVFATGEQGFEHKINRVTRGERLILAGWCT
jgi:hypothetical protein